MIRVHRNLFSPVGVEEGKRNREKENGGGTLLASSFCCFSVVLIPSSVYPLQGVGSWLGVKRVCL